ncbi:MAG: hypothetical protein KAT40_01290 [Bacteroidales bacterium]|nr:hypothetical protein [Bacteroidales bacterium]
MKKLLFFLIASFLFSLTVDAQAWRMRRYEAVLGIGTSHYFGDIGGWSKDENILGLRDIDFTQVRPSIYVGFRYKLYEELALKLNFIYGYLHGDDAGDANDGRNFKFYTGIFEPSFQVEYVFIKEKEAMSYLMMKGRGMSQFNPSISSYVFLGLGGAFFKITKKENLQDVNLDYTPAALVVPLGIGLKYGLNTNWSIGFELGGRFTTSDYIDGYTSEYSESKDVYFFGVINMVYKIETGSNGLPVFKK